MAENYTFNIKLKITPEVQDDTVRQFEEILAKSTKILEGFNSLDIQSLKGAFTQGMGGSPRHDYQSRINSEKTQVEAQIEQLKNIRSFAPVKPMEPFGTGIGTKSDRDALKIELRKEMERDFHSINQRTSQMQRKPYPDACYPRYGGYIGSRL